PHTSTILPYTTLFRSDFGEQNFNNGKGGTREGRLANEDITWEKSRKSNIGIDMGFLQRKLNFSIDLFEDYRYDIITELGSDDIRSEEHTSELQSRFEL